MHEIRETFDVRFMPEISLDKCLTINSTNISQLNYNSVMKLYVWLCTEIANSAFNSIEDN